MKTEVAFLVLLGVATWVSAANLSKKSQEALSNIFRTTFAWDIDVTVSDSDKPEAAEYLYKIYITGNSTETDDPSCANKIKANSDKIVDAIRKKNLTKAPGVHMVFESEAEDRNVCTYDDYSITIYIIRQ